MESSLQQAPRSMGFSRQEYWSGLPFPSPDTLIVVVYSQWLLIFCYFVCCSVAQFCPTLCDPIDCSTTSISVLHYLLELAQTHVHLVCDVIQPSLPLSSPYTPAFKFPSIRAFCKESALPIRWPKYRSFSFNISPSSEYSGLISSRIDWFDFFVVQGALRSLLQHHILKTSILQLTSIHYYWKNHSSGYSDIHQQSNISVF